LRRIHRARSYHADAAHTEHDERILRNLFPSLYRNNLQNPLRPGVSIRDCSRLRGGGGNEIDHPWADHPGDVLAFRAAADRASVLDGFLAVVYLRDVKVARRT